MDMKQEDITTLHAWSIDKKELLGSIQDIANERPVSLVMPMLYQEMKAEALGIIIKGLNKCDYLNQVIIPLAAENKERFQKVKKYFMHLKRPHLIMWCNSPQIQDILMDLKEKGLDLLKYRGKGRDSWLAFGIASLNNYAIILHDADIISYDESFPAKLAYPLLEPELDFKFNKGYYARVNSQKRIMYGRVVRLFLHPLLSALSEDLGKEPDFVRYLKAFRYPLSGEFALTRDLALDIDIPGDWGLEIGILAEMYRNVARKRICQTDLGFYEHKHREVDKTGKGLKRMTHDIFKTLLRVLIETDNIQITEAFLTTLLVTYVRKTQDCIRQYHADAHYNNLHYDRHQEETIMEKFSKTIIEAGHEYLEEPVGTRIPDWLRTMSAIREIREKLMDIVLEENGTT
jgi:glucosyl-3-phosphoglycerate synthase